MVDNQNNFKRRRRRKWFVPTIVIAVTLLLGAFFVLPGLIGGGSAAAAPRQTIVLERTNLTRLLPTSGVVRSSDSNFVFSSQNRPVKEIVVRVGDTVRVGDVLARLDMSNIENEISQTELNLLTARRNAEEEERNNSNSVTNARTNLESARISLQRQAIMTANAERELAEAERDLDEPFDSRAHDRAIADARLSVERRLEEFEDVYDDFLTAQQDLANVREDFDDFVFLNNINEARISLERRLADLADATNRLNEETRTQVQRFVSTPFDNAVNDAERNLERRRLDEAAAFESNRNAWSNYFAAPPELSDAAWAAVQSTQSALNSAGRIVEDAETALERARNELANARRNHNENAADARDSAISAAETAVNNAQNMADDAQRALDRATAELDRAVRNAETAARDALTFTRNSKRGSERNLYDAERMYERTLSDKERAIEDFLDIGERSLLAAQRAFADSQAQLQSAQNSVNSAQHNVEQVSERPAASNVSIEMQELNLTRLYGMLAEGEIIAQHDGVVTEINVNVGGPASGVLFVIEDIENLYVSANVREHSLSELRLGQTIYVTTEVTGDRVFEAELVFISPRSVSPPGSTSVEFEIHADLSEGGGDLRIGMNAFVNVITELQYDVFAVPLSAVAFGASGYFVVAEDGDYTREIPVGTGLRTSTHMEIFGEGLHSGLVILARPVD